MPDRDDQNRVDGESDDIIDEPVSVDTTGFDILGTQTAQVAVALPAHDEDDLVDDDVLADDIALDAAASAPSARPDVLVDDVHIVHEDDIEQHDDAAPHVDAVAPVESETRVEHAHEVDEEIAEPVDAPELPIVDDVAPVSEPVLFRRPDLPPAEPAASARPAEPAPARAAEPLVPAPVTLAARRVEERDATRETPDLLTADRLLQRDRLPRREPEGSWPHFVYALSGGRIRLADSKRARDRRALDARIAAPLDGGARFVAVLSRKGGVGKTTVTALLGMALADAREDRVIALDANPDRGTLAERVGQPSGKTVRDLTGSRTRVHGFNEISSIVVRDETRLDVLASDADPHISEAFDDSDYRDVAALAAHYYSIVLTDTGTGIVHSVMNATLEASDALVIVAGLSVDEARLASETLTWLETNGYPELARAAVVVLNTSRPGTPLVRQDELEEHFRSRVRAVVRLPYDARIATGSAITFRDLQPATRQAARELAAVVVAGIGSVPAVGAA
ncbi:MinD/ParA family protein [Microbacterium sp. cx-59]|uniref:MinD/ParA family ATP-binding protein n=1 Tax=Microbacterium sp. cx-59 TaxID=2891207 RepID=UPI001E4E215B|nr:MinD/ParA family protein [Microbacterium sp. cx-59]MCC4907631.1 MinD/ParA family protein [Microbacterium sp. cx-59]